MYQLYLSLLRKYIQFQSVSTDTKNTDAMYETANRLSQQFLGWGFETQVIEGYGNPIVFASYEVNKNLPTCLIYGHYDVQPASQNEGRSQDPFLVEEKEGRLIGRGVVDNKGQSLIHMVVVQSLLGQKKLGYNIKFLLEGDEETGSAGMEKFLAEHIDRLAADFVLVSDGDIVGDNPVIEAGFRGGCNATIKLQTAKTDLHSGLYGGAVPNAAQEMVRLLQQLLSAQHQIMIPYFYYDVDPVPQEIIQINKSIPFNQKDFADMTGCTKTFGKYDIHTQTGLQPAIEVTTLEAGYQGEGYRNSIPARAIAKLNVRLVAHQNPDHIARNFQNWIEKAVPTYCTVQVKIAGTSPALKINLKNPYTEKAGEILQKVYNKQVVIKYCGGSVPIVGLFQAMGLTPVLVPLGNEDCNMHGVDENFRIDCIHKGLQFSEQFLGK